MSRGWCRKHYTRWVRHGDPTATLKERATYLPWPDNLLQRMEPQPNGCIWFTGNLNRGGYGAVWNGEREVGAHRAAHELFVGPIPEGHTIDHECHNRDESCAGGGTCLHRRCVNWEHLAPKPNGDNSRASRNTRQSINAAKTHCPQGHPYDEANTFVNSKGGRECRTCLRLRRSNHGGISGGITDGG